MYVSLFNLPFCSICVKFQLEHLNFFFLSYSLLYYVLVIVLYVFAVSFFIYIHFRFPTLHLIKFCYKIKGKTSFFLVALGYNSTFISFMYNFFHTIAFFFCVSFKIQMILFFSFSFSYVLRFEFNLLLMLNLNCHREFQFKNHIVLWMLVYNFYINFCFIFFFFYKTTTIIATTFAFKIVFI